MGLHQEARQALEEVGGALAGVDPASVDAFASAILEAGRVTCYGLGREGLVLRAFAMRLAHLGLDAQVAGDVTALPVGPGDLAIIAAGPGDLPLAETMATLARRAGSKVAVLTAQPGGRVPQLADLVLTIPAQTMADDRESASILPMGTAFEIAMLVLLDLVAIDLQGRSGQTLDDLRARHFNLE